MHECGKSDQTIVPLKERNNGKTMKSKAKLQELGKEIRKRMHDPVHKVGHGLEGFLKGATNITRSPSTFPSWRPFAAICYCAG